MTNQSSFWEPPDDEGHTIDPRTLSRRDDPGTSKQAARTVELGKRMAEALATLRLCPDMTAAELDQINGTPEGRIRKRLNDLRTRGLAFTKGERRCSITGRNAQLWYAVTP